MRWIIGVLIALALAAGVFALWPDEAADTPTVTEAANPSTTTSSATTTSTTLLAGTTSTTGVGSHVVTTVEEAEEILRELWFGWFEGIYNQDEDRIREVVGNPVQVDAALAQFGVMEFASEPTVDAILISGVELLRSDLDCLAVWADTTATFRDGSISGVHVFRRGAEDWLLINTWPLRGDLWENDCEAVLDMP